MCTRQLRLWPVKLICRGCPHQPGTDAKARFSSREAMTNVVRSIAFIVSTACSCCSWLLLPRRWPFSSKVSRWFTSSTTSAGNLVVAHRTVFAKRPKRLHSPLLELGSRGVIHFEVQPVLRDEREEQSLGIDSYAPKHGLAGHGRDSAQLFEHKFAIALRYRHRLFGFSASGQVGTKAARHECKPLRCCFGIASRSSRRRRPKPSEPWGEFPLSPFRIRFIKLTPT